MELYEKVQTNDDGIVTRAEVRAYFGGGGRGVDEEEVENRVKAFFKKYTDEQDENAESVRRDELERRFRTALDEEIRRVRQDERKRYDFYRGWNAIDRDLDGRLTKEELSHAFGHESDPEKAMAYAQSIFDVLQETTNSIEKSATYDWIIAVEQPMRERIEELRSAMDPDYDGKAGLEDFLNNAVQEILGVSDNE